MGDENSKMCGNFWLRPKGRRPRPPTFEKNFVETLAGANSHTTDSDSLTERTSKSHQGKRRGA